MQKSQKEIAKEELEKLYDNQFRWVQAGQALRGRFGETLKDNPKLKWIFLLSISANIGIWLTFAFLNI
ncbi:MAG: hypothetical protein FJX30_04760 [Alphaproteobacteria bacterium]|nr:hypothetical protein [Alphaproteobacteria bacterium]NCA27933.1 hypothetical protein [Pseudomonadota bacterium]